MILKRADVVIALPDLPWGPVIAHEDARASLCSKLVPTLSCVRHDRLNASAERHDLAGELDAMSLPVWTGCRSRLPQDV
eukprot:5346652-Heterocapsa_arctica.AAC.1